MKPPRGIPADGARAGPGSGRAWAGLGAVAAAALAVALLRPFGPGLPAAGHAVLGAVIAALGMWIFRPADLPFMAGSAAILGLAVVILAADGAGSIDPATGRPVTVQAILAVATNGFASTSFWTMIPALYFGYALQSTGLGKRIAYLVLKSFAPSWGSIAFSWLVVGLALSALTPSITVRVAIMLPIAMGIVEACGLEPRSRGSAYVCFLAWGMAVFPGTGWMTGTLSGPIIQGFLPAELKPLANFEDWARILGPPWLAITLAYVGLCFLLARPREAIGIPRGAFRDEYAKLGRATRREKLALAVLSAALAMFATERLHGVPIAASALLALLLLALTGIVKGSDIGTAVNWDVAVFFGVAVSLPGIFEASGIADWFYPIAAGPVLRLAGSPAALVAASVLAMIAIRFVDVPWGYATCALTVSLLVPLWRDFGYHPLVPTMAYLVAINFFMLPYQQPWVMMADGMVKGRGWAASHVSLFGGLYLASAALALALAIPYWKAIGVMP